MTLGEYLSAGAAITKGLYHMEGNANDSSGNGSNGTSTSIVYSLANGVFKQGAGFNGSARITLPNLGISGSAARTVAAWVRPTTSGEITVVCWGTSSTGTLFGLRLNNTSAGTIAAAFFNLVWRTAAGLVVTNAWQHLVLAYDGGALTSSSLRAYLNGQFYSMSGTAGTPNTNNSNYAIGVQAITSSLYFSGAMDDVIIENISWTDAQVRRYYTWARGRYANL